MGYHVDVRKLDLFNKMAKEGSNTVADHVAQLTGVDADVKTSQINFLDIQDVKTHMGDDESIGIYIELREAPGGYVLFLFDPEDGKRLAGQMLGEVDESPGVSQMERSALQEIGNIMTSGFIDGWANVLETTMDMTTPTLITDRADAVVDEMGGWPDSDLVFVIDSQLTAEDADVDLTIYTFPELEALVDLIQEIDLDTDVEEDTKPDDLL